MSKLKVTSKNRGVAKRILNAWNPSTTVAKWTLDKLQRELMNAINHGLVARSSVESLLKAADPKSMQMDADAHASADAPEDTLEDVDTELDSIEDMLDNAAQSDNADSEETAAADEVDFAQGDSEMPSAPPPLDSEQPFVTHPELETARNEDRTFAADYAEAAAVKTYKTVNAAVAGKLREHKEQSDARMAEFAETLKKVHATTPKTITVKNPETKSTVKIDNPHPLFETVFMYVSVGLPVALVGPAGCGKSYLTAQLAKALELDYYTNGAMLTKFDIIGYEDQAGNYHSTPAADAYINGGLHVFDELDASSPEAVVAFNGMTDGQDFYTFPHGMKERHVQYRAIACMNTWGNGASSEYVGRFRQDAAAMNRFLRVSLDYSRELEGKLFDADITERGWKLRDACEALGIKHVVSTRTLDYATRMRAAGASRSQIDSHCLFAGLTDDTIKQLKSEMKS
jgi:hypothetical protein